MFKNDEYPVLELYDGENLSVINGRITNFSFSKSEFNLSSFSANTILVKKTQEHETIELFDCVNNLTKKGIKNLEKIKSKVRNCEIKNLDNIIAELYKRLVVPLYIPSLMLVSLLLIIHSKERIDYSKYRLAIFLVGFFIIILSESTLRFVTKSFESNFIIILIPITLIIILYGYFLLKFKIKKVI